MNEYLEFAATIDEFNHVGSMYDASLRGLEISVTPLTHSKLCLQIVGYCTSFKYKFCIF